MLLTRVQLLAHYREPAWLGPQYVGTKHTLRVRALFNPEVNAYAWPQLPSAAAPAANLRGINVGGAGQFTRDFPIIAPLTNAGVPAGTTTTNPGQARGAIAPVTDIAVREWLMQPRRQLVYAMGTTPVLVCPGLNADGTAAGADAMAGPFPLSCDVVQVSGTKSFIVDYAISCVVNEAQLYVATPSVITGHVYERKHVIDQDYYTTIVTRGRAQFRTDRLLFLAAFPDDFRSYFFHPRPAGFKRVHCEVTATEDGSAAEYVVADREMALSIIPAGVTRIECWHNADNAGRDVEGLMFGLAKHALEWFELPEPGAISADPVPGAAEAGAGILAGIREFNHLLRMAQKAVNTSLDFIPRLKCDVVARVWGRQDRTRKELEAVAVNLVLARLAMSVNPVARFLAGTRLALNHDVAGTFVECVGHIETAFSGASVQLGALLGGVPDIGSHFPPGDDTQGILQTQGPDGDGMDLPRGADARGVRSRGTYVGRCVAAALLAPYATPPAPVDPPAGATLAPP